MRKSQHANHAVMKIQSIRTIITTPQLYIT